MTKITSAESEDCGNDDDEDFTLDPIVIPYLMNEARSLLSVSLPIWPDSISIFWANRPIFLRIYQ
jgi:hypothetical protein